MERGLVTNSRWRLKAMEVNGENTISSCSSLEKVILKLQNHTVCLSSEVLEYKQGDTLPLCGESSHKQ